MEEDNCTLCVVATGGKILNEIVKSEAYINKL